jgi:hypothetical protein
MAVLLLPVELDSRALTPLAVLKNPVVLNPRAPNPMAVLPGPIMVKLPAPPTKVLLEPEKPRPWRNGTPPRFITPVVAFVVAGSDI